jgi:hypothetical protein
MEKAVLRTSGRGGYDAATQYEVVPGDAGLERQRLHPGCGFAGGRHVQKKSSGCIGEEKPA